MMKRGKVLVIEDDPDWQAFLKSCLEGEGFYVEVVSDLKAGEEKIVKDMFHFATIDLQLDESTQDPSAYEGWGILAKIIEYRADRYMPTMVITGFDKDYKEFLEIKKLSGTYFTPKKAFDKKKFLDTVIQAVENLDVRFHDDKKQ
jgi:ActR/RegA family two-component response regulator